VEKKEEGQGFKLGLVSSEGGELGSEAGALSLSLSSRLRAKGVPVLSFLWLSPKRQLQKIVQAGASHVVFLDPARSSHVTLKDLATREERELSLDSLLPLLTSLASPSPPSVSASTPSSSPPFTQQ